jgi:hypothetical protein
VSQPNPCRICIADNLEFIEEVGVQCLRGEISWREGAKRAGLKYHQPLTNHMQKHYTDPNAAVSNALDEDLLVEVENAARELLEQMRLAPPEVKPLYAAAIKNLRELGNTKPSQQHLIQSLKAVHEITGMQMEQQVMLAFARHHFGGAIGPVTHDPVRELEMGRDIIEAELVDAE